MSQNQMFCYQCEQTARGTGCNVMGVCGKTPEVANLQDLLVYKLRELSQHVLEAKKAGWNDEKVDVFTAEALFATLTNVNFDPEAIAAYIKKTARIHEQIHMKVGVAASHLPPATSLAELAAEGKAHGINADPTMNPDLHSLQWLLTYGLKGVAAYTYHAYLLGKKDPKIFDFIYEGLSAPLNKALDANAFVGL